MEKNEVDKNNTEKSYRYDYFVDKNNKICPENSEFKPQKVTGPIPKIEMEKPQKTDQSLWNSVGTWEEHTLDIDHYKSFMGNKKSLFRRTPEFAK